MVVVHSYKAMTTGACIHKRTWNDMRGLSFAYKIRLAMAVTEISRIICMQTHIYVYIYMLVCWYLLAENSLRATFAEQTHSQI